MREMQPALKCANTFMVSLMDILLYSPVSVPLTAILKRTMCDHYDIQYITDVLFSLE
jgi:ABC-type tungstate transport system substrate-binding protein